LDAKVHLFSENQSNVHKKIKVPVLKRQDFLLENGAFWPILLQGRSKGEAREKQGRRKGEAREKDFVIKKEINP
jgi:hypothetical protein